MNVTGRRSRPIPDGKGGYFVEEIEAGAFKRAIEKAEEIKILLNHKWDNILGGTKSNLKLKEDVIGLRAHAVITDPTVVKKAKEGRLRGWSFRFFKPKEARASLDNGMELRKITDLEIDEVSLIDERMRPWYESTTVEARSEGKEEIIFEVRAEEFDTEIVGLETDKPDNSKLKDIIKKYGGNV